MNLEEDIIIRVRLLPVYLAISFVLTGGLTLLVIFCLASIFIPADCPPETVVYVIATMFGE